MQWLAYGETSKEIQALTEGLVLEDIIYKEDFIILAYRAIRLNSKFTIKNISTKKESMTQIAEHLSSK